MDSLFKEKEELEYSKMRKRKKKKTGKAVFKPYNQGQTMLLPPSLEELIPKKHLVRVVNKVIESMNIEALIRSYKGGGSSAYDPRMMLKVLVYAYVMKIYTSRKIAKALREDVNFMWISGMQKPDFRTINNFRSGRLRKAIDKIFSSMIIFLEEGKYIKLEDYFIDGTKIEANANRYSYIWAANTKRYKEGRIEKIKELLEKIEKINQQENELYGDKDLEELGEDSQLDSDKIKGQIERLNDIINSIDETQALSKKKKKKLKKTIEQIEKKHLPKLINYEQQQNILAGRKSFSKTDKDATFFVTKTDQLLPCYNVIIGTENQLIVNYSIHQKATETDKFIDHMEGLRELTEGKHPLRVIGDSAYGSEENYDYIDKNQIENYLKYNTFHNEKKNNKNRFHRDNFIYDEQSDTYQCPEGKMLEFEQYQQWKTKSGYIQKAKLYRGKDCKRCKYLKICSKSTKGRTITQNETWETYKRQARDNLTSDVGKQLRKRRSTEVETVFGDIKENQGFRRFNLRGYEKVNIEFGIVSIAHNIKKISAMAS